MVAVPRKLKNANQPATLRKLFLFIRQMPLSFSGGLSCLGFLTSGVIAARCTAGGRADAPGVTRADTGVVAGRAEAGGGSVGLAPPETGLAEVGGGNDGRGLPETGFAEAGGGSGVFGPAGPVFSPDFDEAES
jgi:hypothetical protein